MSIDPADLPQEVRDELGINANGQHIGEPSETEEQQRARLARLEQLVLADHNRDN